MLIPTLAEGYSWNAFVISRIKHGIRIIGAKNPLRNLHSLEPLTDTLTIHIRATIPHLHTCSFFKQISQRLFSSTFSFYRKVSNCTVFLFPVQSLLLWAPMSHLVCLDFTLLSAWSIPHFISNFKRLRCWSSLDNLITQSVITLSHKFHIKDVPARQGKTQMRPVFLIQWAWDNYENCT